MTNKSWHDQLKAWKAKNAESEAKQKTPRGSRESKGSKQKDAPVTNNHGPSCEDPIKAQKAKFLELWSAGKKNNAVRKLAEIGLRQGRLKISPSKQSEIGGLIRFFRKNNDISLDEEVLALLALNDKKNILITALGLLVDFQRKINLEPDAIDTISKEQFDPYVSSVLHITEAQNAVTSHFDDVISLALSRIAEKNVRPFLKQANSLYQFDLNVYAPAPFPTSDDTRLAALWTGDPALEGVDSISKASSIPDTPQQKWELARCLSARLAERVARKMYEDMKCDVEDIASRQLLGGHEASWMLYDLKVDKKKVDVKNARRSFSSNETYSEHCVPRFKSDRELDDVVITGMLSEYQSLVNMFEKATGVSEIIFLGETTRRILEELTTYFCKSEFLDLNFTRGDGQDSRYFLPAWTFSYPEELYANAKIAEETLRSAKLPSNREFDQAKASFLAPLLISGHPESRMFFSKCSPSLSLFAEEVVAVIETFGRSLPALFLCVLRHFLSICRDLERHSEFEPSKYKEILFFEENTSFPAGIFDPLETVKSLIECLSVLWMEKRSAIANYTQFRLCGGTILQGRSGKTEGRWDTLVAHCGGWLLPNGPKCGRYPLVLGKNTLCEECGHLICDESDCGFCSNNCGRYQSSQKIRGSKGAMHLS